MNPVDLSKSKTRWPLKVLAGRVLWTYFVEPAVRFMPKRLRIFRVLALRAMGARVHWSCMIMPGVKVLVPWNLQMGKYAGLGRNAEVLNFSPVSIGDHSLVSQDCYLATGSHDFEHPHLPLTHAPIRIGRNCWLAAGVFVCPGVDIPDGAVVGARSVVGRSLPTGWTVYAGNPCRALRARTMKAASPDGATPTA